MKTSMLNKPSWLLAAVLTALACLAYPQKSLAADTTVSCTAPVVISWAKGGGPTPAANVIIDCTGGSSAGFQFYAFRIKDNPTIASMIPTLVASFVQQFGTGATITLTSNLSDLSGSAWGCGNANCRILDQVFGL